MKKPILIAAALALAGTAGAAGAQSGAYQTYRPADAQTYWQGAPDGLSQRIDWLQQRINRGVADGTLDRREARNAQLRLNALRRDADVLQQRLDDLSRSLRWRRTNGAYGYNNGYPQDARDPYVTDYDASRYYRDDPRYQERRLTAQDEVYRGSDGRYYCRRSDGTTGLIVGGAGGALLGNLLDGGRSRTAGTLIGGALGALLGRSVDQNTDVRCR